MNRLFDFLPLLLAIALVVGYFTFSGQSIPTSLPALPFFPRTDSEPTAALQPLADPTASPRPATRAPAAQSNPAACATGSPKFVGGIAELRAALADEMGDPLDCEQADPAGNTQQKTTKGLAYYRKGANISVFTNGFDHWALTTDGVVHWTGDAVEPPPDATPVR